MMSTRAKFYCQSETRHANADSRTYKFHAVTASEIAEDRRYHRYTPVGSLEISVDNPNVQFEPGKSYYLDITEA